MLITKLLEKCKQFIEDDKGIFILTAVSSIAIPTIVGAGVKAAGDAVFGGHAAAAGTQAGNEAGLIGQNYNGNQLVQGEQTLADQLAAQAQGQGPNPALEQLKQTTDMNNRMAASQISSQKGINPALAARLGMQQGAANNQGAAGQAATLRAQQILAAQQGLQHQQALMQGGINSQNQLNSGANRQNSQNANNVVGGFANGLGASAAQGALGGMNKPDVSGPLLQENGENWGPLAEQDFSKGGRVLGKAKVQGDSRENDIVPAMLSPGEGVITREAMDDPDKAHEFLDALLKQKSRDEPKGYARVLKAHREMGKHLKRLSQKE